MHFNYSKFLKIVLFLKIDSEPRRIKKKKKKKNLQDYCKNCLED